MADADDEVRRLGADRLVLAATRLQRLVAVRVVAFAQVFHQRVVGLHRLAEHLNLFRRCGTTLRLLLSTRRASLSGGPRVAAFDDLSLGATLLDDRPLAELLDDR